MAYVHITLNRDGRSYIVNEAVADHIDSLQKELKKKIANNKPPARALEEDDEDEIIEKVKKDMEAKHRAGKTKEDEDEDEEIKFKDEDHPEEIKKDLYTKKKGHDEDEIIEKAKKDMEAKLRAGKTKEDEDEEIELKEDEYDNLALKKAKATNEALRAKIKRGNSKEINRRVKVLNIASQILKEDLDDLTDLNNSQIKKRVINKVFPEIKTDEKDSTYISAVFDVACEQDYHHKADKLDEAFKKDNYFMQRPRQRREKSLNEMEEEYLEGRKNAYLQPVSGGSFSEEYSKSRANY